MRRSIIVAALLVLFLSGESLAAPRRRAQPQPQPAQSINWGPVTGWIVYYQPSAVPYVAISSWRRDKIANKQLMETTVAQFQAQLMQRGIAPQFWSNYLRVMPMTWPKAVVQNGYVVVPDQGPKDKDPK